MFKLEEQTKVAPQFHKSLGREQFVAVHLARLS